MKKFAKGCLIAAISMLFTGIIILIICLIIGGSSIFNYLKNNASHHAQISTVFDDAVITFHNREHNLAFSNQHPTHSGKHENMQVATTSDISNLNIDFGGGMCILSESSDEFFHIYTENANEFQYFTEDNTLYLKGFDDVTLGLPSGDYNKVYLEIPKNFTFKNIDIELGAGYLEALSLTASNNIEIEVGAGELITKSLTADTLQMELGAGNVEIDNGSISDSDISVGFGNLTYHGVIRNDLTAECGMGNLELFLNDSYESHNYEVDCGMGNMTLHEKTISAIAYNSDIQHNAASTYTLECGMGNMTVLFNN